MKNYKQLVKSLPSKTVVFAFGRFNPPTTGHELLIKAVKKLAEKNKAAHVIYASKTQNNKKDPLSVDKKIQYLNLLFPNTNFIAATQEVASFIQAAEQLNKKYKNIIMVAGSDRVPEYTRILNTYNGKNFNFDSIQVISAGERDPDADNATGMSATKMRAAASKGEFNEFKKGLPSHIRDIDARRLMNDVRTGLGLEIIKEQIKFSVDETREKYFQGSIFLEGQLVESAGKQYTIIKRGSNHLLLEDSEGTKVSKWIKDVTLLEDVIGGAIPKEITFNGYTTKNLHHSEDAIRAFLATIQRLGNSHHDQDILHALKATDTYMKLNDMHLEQGIAPDQKELAKWRAAHAEARTHLAKMGEFMHHMDYWHMHEHEIQDMEANYTPETAGAEMNEELTTKTIKASDKLKVARMIASFLGNDDAEKSSNPENLVNTSLRKVKSKLTHTDSLNILKKMLHLADEVGIEYDHSALPQKMQEVHEPRVVAIDKKSKRNAGGDILSLKDFNKLSKVNKGVTEQLKHDPATGDVDVQDDEDELNIVNPDGVPVPPQTIQHTKVGHSLTYPDNDTNRRMKVKYKTEEVDLNEVSTQKAREVHSARVDQYNAAKKSGDAEATEKAKGKMKSSFKHYLAKDTKDIKNMYDKHAPKGDEAIKKAANAEYEYNKSKGLSNEEVELDEYNINDAKRHAALAHKAQADEYKSRTKQKFDDSTTNTQSKNVFDTIKNKILGKTNEEVELDEDKMKMTYKDWLKQNNKQHSPENTELYKKTQKEGVIQPNGTDKVTEAMEVTKPKKQVKTPVKDDSYQIGANNAKGFDAFFEECGECEDEALEKDLDAMADSVKDENDILDAYDDDELAIIDGDDGEEIHSTIKEEVEALNEVLSRAERVRAKIRFAKSESKRERKIQLALKRHSDTKTLNNRARRLAVVLMKKRLAKKPLESLSLAEKERIEKIIEKRKTAVGRLAMKLVGKVRKIEQERLAHNKYTKK